MPVDGPHIVWLSVVNSSSETVIALVRTFTNFPIFSKTQIMVLSIFSEASYIPPDPVFELTKDYLADQDPQKVNLGQGTYRDNNGNPWILPSVQLAKEKIFSTNHEYLPIAGLQGLRDSAVELVFDGDSAYKEGRVRWSPNTKFSYT